MIAFSISTAIQVNTNQLQVSPDVAIEEELEETEDTQSPTYRCVLERKGSYLPARRSPETSDPVQWDLAAAGLHKRQTGTEVVKRLKHVIIQFDAQSSKWTSGYFEGSMLKY